MECLYNKPEIPDQTGCYKQEFVISEQFPMSYCSTWLRSLLCHIKKFVVEELVIRVFHCTCILLGVCNFTRKKITKLMDCKGTYCGVVTIGLVFSKVLSCHKIKVISLQGWKDERSDKVSTISRLLDITHTCTHARTHAHTHMHKCIHAHRHILLYVHLVH